MIARLLVDHPNATLSLNDRVNQPYFRYDGKYITPPNNGYEGVDAVLTLSDGGKIFGESKNWGKRASAAENDELWEKLDQQLFKHLQTKIVNELTGGRPPRFENVPVLQYHLIGSFFEGVTSAQMAARFNKLLKEKYVDDFQDLVDAGFEFKPEHFKILNTTAQELEKLHPLVN